MARRAQLARLVEVGVRYRYVVLTVAAALIWLDTANAVGFDGNDWHFFVAGARAVTGSAGLSVYARMPYLQFGPIALMVGVVFRYAGPHEGWLLVSALDMVLGLATIRLLEGAFAAGSPSSARVRLCVLIGGPFFLATWASPGVSEGHPDDVLALFAIAVAVRLLMTGRWALAAVAVGLAADAKPWALLVLPLAAACQGARVRGLVVAVVTAAIPWLPFFAADGNTRRVGEFHLGVEPTSTLHYLGIAVGSAPGWPREVQLAVALLLGAAAVARGRWLLVPLVAFAVRVNLDPAAVDYYAAGPVLGALIWDLADPRRLAPARTIATWFALLYVPSDLLSAGARGSAFHAVVVALRLAVLVTAAWGVVRAPTQGPGSPPSAR
ncbi:MAG TPA: hypothetical protein VHB69_01680 [Mycobacteriales bacterium]|nr:hypothetical protein [Mycobacteriales bacterium]